MYKNWLFYIAVLAGLLFLAQNALNDYYLRVLAVLGINIILVVSLNLTNGYTGDFSLGHAAFMAIGAYVSALLTLPVASKARLIPDLPPWLAQVASPFLVAILLGGLSAALVAAVVGIPVLRLRGHYLAVATLGLMVIVRTVAINWTTITRGAKGINGLPSHTSLWWAYGWTVVTIYVVWRLVNSSYGRGMVAIREDYVAAAARGVNITGTRMLAFCVGAFFAGAAGSLWAHLITAITPHSFSFLITFNVVVMLVVGGAGSISGAVVGAAVMTLVPELLRRVETSLSLGGHPLYGLSQIIVSLTIALVIIYRRQGMMGGQEIRLPKPFRS
jgi:branched-chain amino acid transport system permease protein